MSIELKTTLCLLCFFGALYGSLGFAVHSLVYGHIIPGIIAIGKAPTTFKTPNNVSVTYCFLRPTPHMRQPMEIFFFLDIPEFDHQELQRKLTAILTANPQNDLLDYEQPFGIKLIGISRPPPPAPTPVIFDNGDVPIGL